MQTRILSLVVILAAASAAQDKPIRTFTTASGIKVDVLREGEKGTEPAVGEKVRIHYVGLLEDGTKFDSSRDRSRPLEFVAGRRRMPVRGLDEGILLMPVGSIFRFTIPPKLGFRGRRPADVPADATLVFTVELLAILRPPAFRKPDPEKQKTTKSGLKYEIVKEGAGTPAKADQGVKLRFAVWSGAGAMVTCTEIVGRHIAGAVGLLRLTQYREKFLAEAARLMKPGAVVRFEVPPSLCWGDRKIGVAEAGSNTIWELEQLGTFDVPPFQALDHKKMQKTLSGLLYEIIEEGTGKRPDRDDLVEVHYTGWLRSGKLFDSSHARGETTQFRLGGTIPGWIEGVQLMKEGAVYRFVVPPELGYRDQEDPMGLIPANSTLVFLIELKKVG